MNRSLTADPARAAETAGPTARGVSGAWGRPATFQREEFSQMHVLITARHLNLKPETKAYAEEKAGKEARAREKRCREGRPLRTDDCSAVGPN